MAFSKSITIGVMDSHDPRPSSCNLFFGDHYQHQLFTIMCDEIMGQKVLFIELIKEEAICMQTSSTETVLTKHD